MTVYHSLKSISKRLFIVQNITAVPRIRIKKMIFLNDLMLSFVLNNFCDIFMMVIKCINFTHYNKLEVCFFLQSLLTLFRIYVMRSQQISPIFIP